MGIQTYTIQKGDTLTKIAAEHYGLKGGEAYKKALEIAKDNNIANPNLIYAGASLNLLFDDEPKANEAQGQQAANAAAEQPAVEHENENPVAAFINMYHKLANMQKDYIQYQDAKEGYAEAPKDFNPETDTKLRFAEAEIFETDDVPAKVKAYADAALELAGQDIEANDKEDENGEKDGKISYEEFETSEMEFFEASQGAAMRLRAEDQFALEYLQENGVLPSEDLIKEAGKQAYDSLLTQYKVSLSEMFQVFDVDGSGFLEKTEVATGYVMQDASTTVTENAIKLIGSNDQVLMAFDGEINFDDTAIYVKDADEAKEYQRMFGTDYIPVYYTAEQVKDIHNNMFAA